MTCTRPLDGYRARGGAVIIVKRGDRPPRDSTTRIPMSIPCSKCVGCRLEKARQWGIRCLHEKKLWPHSVYVTLTYSDEHLPVAGSLSLRDVQLFMKRLREKKRRDALELGVKGVGRPLELAEKKALTKAAGVRFFLGAEYGEKNGRPHYHALLFNCSFRDCVFFTKNERGEPLYTSRELSDLWSVDGCPIGHCTVGEVTFDSATYCAKYALKKVTGDPAYEAYQVYDEDGNSFQRKPEFAVMSRFPGIGAGYFEKYGEEVKNWDNVIVDGKPCRPPRYYDDLARRALEHDASGMLCHCKVCVNTRKRKRLSVLNRHDNTEERLRVKEKLIVLAAEKKERKL